MHLTERPTMNNYEPSTHLVDYIRRPDTIDQKAIGQLKDLIRQYPYYQVARILLLQALYRMHSSDYDATLRRSAILVPERNAIFHLTEKPHYTRIDEHKRYSTGYGEDESRSQRTATLIDSFLDNQPQVAPARPSHPVDAAQDYIGYLLQRESESGESVPEALPLNGGGVVEDFLEKEPGRIKLHDVDESGKDENNSHIQPDIEKQESGENGDILTEIMAGIYIKQGKYENAVKIIRQLSLKYPKKNRYFADQIRFLEKLIINNKHK